MEGRDDMRRLWLARHGHERHAHHEHSSHVEGHKKDPLLDHRPDQAPDADTSESTQDDA